MFTGLISDVGEIVEKRDGGFTIATRHGLTEAESGASISCDGVCLTVTAIRRRADGAEFAVDVSNETLSRTTLAEWRPGRRVNLERSLKAGDELGGHIVSGHVDGIARILSISEDGASRRFLIAAPDPLARYVAPKGSIALDGTSLTVNEVSGTTFGVNLIPHSLTVTTWGAKRPGDNVNMEVDVMARYVARLMEFRS